jgi:catechol 2,3-dioxygenase-like lactoylglutathione lyase family enzyme
MEQRLSIITLGVSDLLKATRFYEDKFGWKKSDSSNENISFFVLNGIQLALFERNELAEDATISAEGNGFKGVTLAYNTRSKEEVDELIQELKSKGVEIVKYPEKVVWGGYSAYISDLDENLWEICYNPYIVFDDKGNLK